jgi:type II secretory ATPase GspE/PulE/Tfp pilus assembly ATPase PilB-like protein/ActR/RegA family two-component response regulator
MTPTGSPTPPDAWLGPYLVRGGLLDSDRLDATPVPIGGRLWEAVVTAGHTSTDAIVAMLGEHFKLEVANLAAADPRAATVVPESVARKHRVVPVAVDEKVITVATSDPRDIRAEQDLEFVSGRQLAFQMAAPDLIDEKLDELYRPENKINRLLAGLNPAGTVEAAAVAAEAAVEDDRDPALDAPMSKLVDALISDSVRAGASDIHSELESTEIIVRYRVDGVLREVMRLPAAAGPALVRRVKIVAGLDVTNSMTPQDGRSSARVDGQTVDLRVATAPVARRGEKLVIRILSKANLKASIPELLLPPEEEAVLMQMLGHREGMLLVTGPTGSGKTTTLYAVLNHLKTGKVNIVTVEDPVEYDIDGISQMQVNESQGFTFATALRSVLRQDPDIVLVGEIRDLETATIAIQAGLTGHFVFSTLHTNDAASAIVRLRDMGVDSFKIGSVCKGIIAQRLVRRLCRQCAEPVPTEEIPKEARPPKGYKGTVAPQRAPGCRACAGSGYHGRVAVMEVFPVEGDVPRLIESGATLKEITDAARPHGMRTLWESGLVRYWLGLTSFDEIHRVLGEAAHQAEDTSGRTRKARSTRKKQPAEPSGDEDGAEGGDTILIADDDAAMRRLLRTVLEREGFAVREASDGLETLEAVDQGDVALVILDHDMPNLTGLGVLEELRARTTTAGLPVIMLTARTDDTELHALELGAQDFLTKPVTPRSLVARVKAVLKRTRME